MAQSLMKHYRFTSIPIAIGYEEALFQTTAILITLDFITVVHTWRLQGPVSESAWCTVGATINDHDFEFTGKTLGNTNVSSR